MAQVKVHSLFTEFDGAGYDEVNFFTNALNTSTTGFDFVGTYNDNIGDDKLGISLALNINETKVDGINTPRVFANNNIDIGWKNKV